MTKSNKREKKEEREEVGGMGRRDKEGGIKEEERWTRGEEKGGKRKSGENM